jgi:hypothetical protein
MPTDVEIARAGVMKELEEKRRHQKIYDDSKIEAAKKIGEL